MITVFSIPKAFDGHTGVIQRNALGSWIRVIPGRDVILLGDDSGVAAAASEAGARHIPGVRRNELGTPLLDSAFALAAQNARFPLLCYINADIILTSGFARAAENVPLPRFLLIGRRTDLDVTEPLAFEPRWEEAILSRTRMEGHLLHPFASDFFVFPAATGLAELPPFAVGRPGWDNWFIGHALASAIPVVDITPATTVIHQNHGYGHVKQSRDGTWKGPEGDANRALAGAAYSFSVLNATHRLENGRILRNSRARYVLLRIGHAAKKRLAAVQRLFAGR